jgi:RHS repeat-associated protein
MLLTSYAYDQVNHLTQVAMPRNTANGMVTQTRTFVYDPTTQRLTSATNPENGTVSYTYNADGTLATKKDANGNSDYTYDTYGRLTAIPDRGQTFTYDTCPANDSFCTSTPGQLVEAVFGSMVGPNELSFQYDYTCTPAGKVASKALTLQSANHLSFGGQIEASGTLTASYTYDNQGALTSLAYPAAYPTIIYTLDAMERPTGNGYASGATYNAANQPLYDGTSTRTYNSLLQVQTVTGPGMNMTYKYSSTQNNGQVASSVDGITSEAVTYKYDALKRLLQAGGTTGGTNWVENYVYDGYGNLTQMNPTGTASGMPSMNLSIALDANNVPNNRILGATYDQNGNLIVAAGVVYQYDVANRLSEVQTNGNYYYGYDSDNRRIYYRDNNNNETIYFYGADGQKLATYTYNITNSGNPQIQFTQQSYNVYFLGKLILAEGTSVATDRLGSVRSGGPGGLGYQAQYPYGVEYTLTANDREKYATYTRDSLTGLDYATNRYYSSQWGRFLSPDPYPKRVGNRYAYAHNDPVNNNDPTGLDPCDAKTSDDQGDGDCQNGGGGGGGACSVSTGADGTPVYDCGTSWGTTGTGVGDPPLPIQRPIPPIPRHRTQHHRIQHHRHFRRRHP